MYRILLLSSLILLSSYSQASNLNFLKNSPIAHFNQQDTKLMEDNLFKALNTLSDGEKSAWKNNKTGNSGLANPLKTYKQNTATCRTLRIINRSKKNISESEFDFCQDKNKKWTLNTEKKR